MEDIRLQLKKGVLDRERKNKLYNTDEMFRERVYHQGKGKYKGGGEIPIVIARGKRCQISHPEIWMVRKERWEVIG